MPFRASKLKGDLAVWRATTRYPGERPVDHDLRSEEYGPGGWTDEQQQIWIVIVKDSR